MANDGRFEQQGDLIRALNVMLAPRLEKLGEVEASNVREDISIPVQVVGDKVIRSAPGEPPRTETGDLLAHVAYAVVPQDDGLLQLVVYAYRPSGDPYVAQKLEHGWGNVAPRPFMAPALGRLSQAAVDALTSFE